MKKTFFTGMTMIAISAVIAVGAFNPNDSESELFLAGTEALAFNGEEDPLPPPPDYDPSKGEAPNPVNCIIIVCTQNTSYILPGEETVCISGSGSCTPQECTEVKLLANR